RPAAGPKIEEEGRVRIGLIGRLASTEPAQDHVARLQKSGGLAEDVGLMPAQPEHLRSDMEGLGYVTGAPVHGLDADPIAHLASFIDGAVVAIEHPRTDGAALRIERGDRGTLPGQADRYGSMAPSEKPSEGGQRLRGALAPIVGVLFRPPRTRL